MKTKFEFLKDLEARLEKIAKEEFSSDEEAEVAAWYLAISRECEQHGVKFDSKKLKSLMPDLGKVKQELNRVLYDDLTTEKDPRYDNYYIFPQVSKWKKRCLENDPQCVTEWRKKMGSKIKLGEDARMSQSFLKNILETTNELLDMVDVNEDLDDWVDAKITKAHEALQDVYNFLRNYDKNW